MLNHQIYCSCQLKYTDIDLSTNVKYSRHPTGSDQSLQNFVLLYFYLIHVRYEHYAKLFFRSESCIVVYSMTDLAIRFVLFIWYMYDMSITQSCFSDQKAV